MRHNTRLTQLEQALRKRPTPPPAVLTDDELLQRAIATTAETWPEPPTLATVSAITAAAARLVG